MKGRRKQFEPSPGDVFLIRQSDLRFTAGQVLDCPNRNIATIALVWPRFDSSIDATTDKVSTSKVFAAISTTSDLLKSGDWDVLGKTNLILPRQQWPNESTRTRDWIGMTVQGSGLVEAFLEACIGKTEWDDWYDPNFWNHFSWMLQYDLQQYDSRTKYLNLLIQ